MSGSGLVEPIKADGATNPNQSLLVTAAPATGTGIDPQKIMIPSDVLSEHEPGPEEQHVQQVNKSQRKNSSIVNSKQLKKLSTLEVLKEFYAPSPTLSPLAVNGVDAANKLSSVSSGGESAPAKADSAEISPDRDREATAEGDVTADDQQLPEEEVEGSVELEEHGKCYECFIRSRGILLALLCSLQYSAVVYIIYWLLSVKKFHEPLLITIRFAGMGVFTAILIPYFTCCKHVNVVAGICPPTTKENKWSVFQLVLLCLAGCSSAVLHVYSLEYLSPGDSTVIVNSNPIFVALAARIFLKEKLCIFQIIIALFAIFGVLVISRPPFLVGQSNYEVEQLIGLGLAIAGLFTMTMGIICLRVLRSIHFTFVDTIYGLAGTVYGIILALVTNGFEVPKDIDWLDSLLMVLIAVLAFGAFVSLTLAMEYEAAGPVAMTRSCEVIFSFLWPMITHKYPDYISLAGAGIILLCILLTGFCKYLAGMEETNKLRRKFWFVLK